MKQQPMRRTWRSERRTARDSATRWAVLDWGESELVRRYSRRYTIALMSESDLLSAREYKVLGEWKSKGAATRALRKIAGPDLTAD